MNRRTTDTMRKTIETLGRQVTVLGQCVVCGELDHQDGVRIADKFYCARRDCLAKAPTVPWAKKEI